jgi:hypothetical protein
MGFSSLGDELWECYEAFLATLSSGVGAMGSAMAFVNILGFSNNCILDFKTIF